MIAARTIARNVRALREAAGLSQAEACRALAFEGVEWSPAVWSSAERSAETERVRAFVADEVAALARMFRVSVAALFGDNEACSVCRDRPPAGFTCNACGKGATERPPSPTYRFTLVEQPGGGA